MILALFAAGLLAAAALLGAVSRTVARSTATGVLAGIAALVGGAYFSLVAFALAIGEYEEDRPAYEEWVGEVNFFVGLAVHMVVPAAVLVLTRLAVNAVRSADHAADERARDGQDA